MHVPNNTNHTRARRVAILFQHLLPDIVIVDEPDCIRPQTQEYHLHDSAMCVFRDLASAL